MNTTTFPVVVIDQFSLTPYALEQMAERGEHFTVEDFVPGGAVFEEWTYMRRPQVLHVTEDYRPPWATTVLRPNAEGHLEAWRWCWDTSG